MPAWEGGRMSSILCITTEGLPGIRACTHRGSHLESCMNDSCTGCAPREAERGFLCQRCFERVEHAIIQWPRFASALHGVTRAVSVDTAGRGGSAVGYTPLPGTVLALDECRRLLRSLPEGPRGLSLWVTTEEGARDAIMFAHAADRAYRTHEIEERESRLRRVRCPRCEQLSLIRRPPQFQHEPVEVECQNPVCGYVFVEGRHQAVAYRATADGWEQVALDAVAVIERIERKERA